MMKRTSVLLPEDIYAAAVNLAESRGERLSDVIRSAVRLYVNATPPRRQFTFIGSGASGEGDLSMRVDEILAEELEKDYEEQLDHFRRR